MKRPTKGKTPAHDRETRKPNKATSKSSSCAKITTFKATKRALEEHKDDQLLPKRTKKSAAKAINVLAKHSKATKVKHAQPPAPKINQAPNEVLAVFATGNGESGELGLGPSVTETVRPRANLYLDPGDESNFHVVQLDCGGMHTIALTDNNQIITWGVNDKGALGRDTTWGGGLERDIDEDASDASGDLNPLESTPAQVSPDCFPPKTKFVQVAAGDSCSFALTDAGLVYGWGTFRNDKGNDLFSIDKNGVIVEVQPKPTLVSGLVKVTQITCGANHALALDVSGNIWAWGSGEQNQLGRRVMERRKLGCLTPSRVGICRGNAKFIASGEYHSFAIDQKDNVWAWGVNSFGEAGYVEAAGSDSALLPHPMMVQDLCGKKVISLDGGSHHSAAVTAEGECLAWGRMDCGQLGIDFTPGQLRDASLIRRDGRGDPRICLRPTVVPGVGKVVKVSCGTDHTLYINREGKAYATGFGSQGQLGLGSYDDTQVAQLVGGKAVRERTLTWAGAGGQFSMLAAPVIVVNKD